MKPGDLVTLSSNNPALEGSYGYSFDYDPEDTMEAWVPKDDPWVPNGTIGMYYEDPGVSGGKFGVLVEGRILWFDPLDSRVIEEIG